MTTELQMALEAGFTYAVAMDVTTLDLKQEVRHMCANGCHQYNKRWSCPPGCGELTALRQLIQPYTKAILVQTVGQLEDAFDGEAMIETEQQHKEQLLNLQQELLKHHPKLLTLGAGCCTLCEECSYPDAPCRLPQKKIVPMEAYGLLVADVCKQNGLRYGYGESTITYTSCFLLE